MCAAYRGTSRFFSSFYNRDHEVATILLVLILISLISITVNILFCLRGRNKQLKPGRHTPSRDRSPRLPSADITAMQHTQNQIPIFREIQSINRNKTGNVFAMEILDKPSATMTTQSQHVLEMIEKLEDEDDSDDDDTAFLLK